MESDQEVDQEVEEGPQLEIANEPEFVTFYKSLPEKPSTCFRFFDRCDYYTVHGEDAEFVANEILKTRTVIKQISQISSVAISGTKFEPVVRELVVVRHYKVEIYREEKKGKSSWSLHLKASPGNLEPLEDLLCWVPENLSTSGLLAINLIEKGSGSVSLGVAFVDNLTRSIKVVEFEDDLYMTSLESLLVTLGPKESVVSTSFKHKPRLVHILKRSNILLTEVSRELFNADHLEQDLKRILVCEDSSGSSRQWLTTLSTENCPLSRGSLAVAIKYLSLAEDESSQEQYKFEPIKLSLYMKLDSAAIDSLNLFPTASGTYLEKAKKTSIFSLLNQCRTYSGQRLLSLWIRQPLVDLKRIEERLDIVEYFMKKSETRQMFSEVYLKKVPDLNRLSKKFQLLKANLSDCCHMYQVVSLLPDIKSSLEKHESMIIKETFVKPLMEFIEKLGNFRLMIETSIDLNQEDASGDFKIKPDINPELQEVEDQLKKTQKNANRILRIVADDLGLEAEKSVKFEISSEMGFVFKVTKKFEQKIRNKKSYKTIDRVKQDGVRFVNSQLDELNSDYVELRAQYEDLQKETIDGIIETAAGYCDVFRRLGDLLALVDVYVSLAGAALSSTIPYVRPKLLPKGSGRLELIEARHPCLDAQETGSFIPNDVTFDPNGKKFFFITGPNMGGKSTFIRSVGICVLMAQMGSFVPAASAHVPVVDGLFTRVGACDQQLQGVSTFMAEMVETASILRVASENSLIIVDELGRGTSTADGFGLAWAISEHIAQKIRPYCLFATHFHELTALSNEISSIGNLHVSAQMTEDILTMLYKVEEGICDQSFGIHVMELTRFPPEMIQYARNKVKQLEALGEQSKVVKIKNLVSDKLKTVDCNNMTDQQVIDMVKGLKQEVESRFGSDAL